MDFLQGIKDHLCTKLKLDKTSVFAWVDDGQITANAGPENNHFKVKYTACLTIEGFSGPLVYLLLQSAKYWAQKQSHFAGATHPKFEYTLASKRNFNVYLSFPVTEILTISEDADGTYLDIFVTESPNDTEPVVLADVTTVHVPGGQADG